MWMAAAAERTKRMTIGTGVTAPILRYHPAIVAQAFATLGHLYPGRIKLGVGTGEAMNELPLGFPWAALGERAKRLVEAVRIIRELWTGEFITFKGKYYRLNSAKLYTTPEKPVPIYFAAFGPKMARLAGKYGDGLYSSLTHNTEHFRDVVLPAFRDGAGEVNRNPEELGASIEMQFSYDADLDKAATSIRKWAGALLPVFFKYGISDPREIEENALKVGVEEMKKAWVVTDDPFEVAKRAEGCLKAGFKEVVFMSSSPDQQMAIKTVGKEVIPYLKENFAVKR